MSVWLCRACTPLGVELEALLEKPNRELVA
jgi:hypothetical protein